MTTFYIFLQYFKFLQNQISGLYDKTRYFKMVTFTWILWIPSKITFSCQYSHVTCSVVVIFGNAKNNFPKSRFWPNFDQKRGIFDPYLKFWGQITKIAPYINSLATKHIFRCITLVLVYEVHFLLFSEKNPFFGGGHLGFPIFLNRKLLQIAN
jgi:hypothetical protein